LHVTLVFLGDLSIEDVDRLKVLLKSLPLFESFALSFSSFKSKRSQNKGRIYWLEAKQTPEILQLRQSLLEISQIVQPKVTQDRHFRPHMTLSRASSEDPDLDSFDFHEALELFVERVALYQSVTKKEG